MQQSLFLPTCVAQNLRRRVGNDQTVKCPQTVNFTLSGELSPLDQENNYASTTSYGQHLEI
jgi:hypothetical protein